MEELVTYITPEPESEEYGIQDGGIRFVLVEGGYGMPPVEYITDKGFQQHGETAFGFRLQPRVVTLELVQDADNPVAHWERRAELLDMLRQNRQGINAFNPGRVRKYLPGAIVGTDSRRRDLLVFYEGGLILDDDGSRVDHNIRDIVSFVAHDPVWLDPVEQSQVWGIDIEANWILDTVPPSVTNRWVFPFWFGPAIVAESQNVTYVGTWLSYPTIVVIGPAQRPLIENRTTGEKLELNYDVSPLETVTFNLEYGQKTVLSDTAGNLTRYLTSDSDLATFHLEPDPGAAGGVNEVYVQFSGWGGDSAATLSWYVRYIGI